LLVSLFIYNLLSLSLLYSFRLVTPVLARARDLSQYQSFIKNVRFIDEHLSESHDPRELQRINVVIALSIRETVNENSESRNIGFVKNRPPMKALTNHIAPSLSRLFSDEFALFSFTSSPSSFLPSVSLSLFLLVLALRALVHGWTGAHTRARAHHQEHVDRFYFPPLAPRQVRPTRAEANFCTLIQSVRIKDIINNAFNSFGSSQRFPKASRRYDKRLA